MTDGTAIRQLVADRTNAMRAGDADFICRAYASDTVIYTL